MALKKTLDTRKKRAGRVKAAVQATRPSAVKPAAARRIWTLPVAAMALVFASGGLWLAARETSSATQAAASVPAHAVIAPETPSDRDKPAAAGHDTPKPAETTRAGEAAPPVSIAGCLQRGGDGFVLKDVEGAAAPKGRSWRSAFIRKGNAPVDLREASTAAHLGSHVGQRVRVSGRLVNREMRVVSLHRLAAACE